MYESYFSLKCKPFELVPNPDFLFPSRTHKKAITYLDYGIKEKIGFILITGEIGSGKTTIVRNFIKDMDSSVRLSRINNTKVSSEQLISMINEDFGLDIEGKSKTKLLSELNEFLIDQYSKHLQPVLLIDEAQNLSPDLLEEIRLLSNLETDRTKLLQIILVGQPELKKTLTMPQMMQLHQRISINYHIAPLSIDETAEYIKYRLSIAGNSDVIKVHNDDMLALIYQFSRGIPRLVNILCDFALLSAYVEEKRQVDVEIVKEVAKDLSSRNYWKQTKDNKRDAKSRSETFMLQGNTEDDENNPPSPPFSKGGVGGFSGEKEPDALEVAGNLALRVVRLEEKMKKSFSEISDLIGRIQALENEIAGLKESDDDRVWKIFERMEEKRAFRILNKVTEKNRFNELAERISKLEEMLLVSGSDKEKDTNEDKGLS